MIYGICAISQNNVIGYNNKIPWQITEDIDFFKEKTINNAVIMGRKTYESIGKTLPNRNNIIITSNNIKNQQTDLIVVKSLQNAVIKSKEFNTKTFIIGGGEVFHEALNAKLIDTFYLTLIHKDYQGDCFLDLEVIKHNFTLKEKRELKTSEAQLSFLTFIK